MNFLTSWLQQSARAANISTPEKRKIFIRKKSRTTERGAVNVGSWVDPLRRKIYSHLLLVQRVQTAKNPRLLHQPIMHSTHARMAQRPRRIQQHIAFMVGY